MRDKRQHCDVYFRNYLNTELAGSQKVGTCAHASSSNFGKHGNVTFTHMVELAQVGITGTITSAKIPPPSVGFSVGSMLHIHNGLQKNHRYSECYFCMSCD